MIETKVQYKYKETGKKEVRMLVFRKGGFFIRTQEGKYENPMFHAPYEVVNEVCERLLQGKSKGTFDTTETIVTYAEC